MLGLILTFTSLYYKIKNSEQNNLIINFQDHWFSLSLLFEQSVFTQKLLLYSQEVMLDLELTSQHHGIVVKFPETHESGLGMQGKETLNRCARSKDPVSAHGSDISSTRRIDHNQLTLIWCFHRAMFTHPGIFSL